MCVDGQVGCEDGEDVIERGGERTSLAKGTQQILNARLKGPIWSDRNQEAWPGPEPRARHRGWGSIGESAEGGRYQPPGRLAVPGAERALSYKSQLDFLALPLD